MRKHRIILISVPLTDAQVDALKEWQACGWVHPLTCCDHVSMVPTREGLVCPKCDYVQTDVPKFVLDGLPPDPMKVFLEQ